jgi:hypothetical protein
VLRLPVPWAGLVAALFAVHPVHSESICYVVWRNEDAIDFDPGLEDVQKITKKHQDRNKSPTFNNNVITINGGLFFGGSFCLFFFVFQPGFCGFRGFCVCVAFVALPCFTHLSICLSNLSIFLSFYLSIYLI